MLGEFTHVPQSGPVGTDRAYKLCSKKSSTPDTPLHTELPQALAKVASNWAEQRATFVDKPGQGVALLTVADAVVELLENDTLTLQGLASSKFVVVRG